MGIAKKKLAPPNWALQKNIARTSLPQGDDDADSDDEIGGLIASLDKKKLKDEAGYDPDEELRKEEALAAAHNHKEEEMMALVSTLRAADHAISPV